MASERKFGVAVLGQCSAHNGGFLLGRCCWMLFWHLHVTLRVGVSGVRSSWLQQGRCVFKSHRLCPFRYSVRDLCGNIAKFCTFAVFIWSFVVHGVILSVDLAFVFRIATWLILPVVIRSSQRLSHACLSINLLL